MKCITKRGNAGISSDFQMIFPVQQRTIFGMSRKLLRGASVIICSLFLARGTLCILLEFVGISNDKRGGIKGLFSVL